MGASNRSFPPELMISPRRTPLQHYTSLLIGANHSSKVSKMVISIYSEYGHGYVDKPQHDRRDATLYKVKLVRMHKVTMEMAHEIYYSKDPRQIERRE